MSKGPVALAKLVVESFVTTGGLPSGNIEGMPEWMSLDPQGCFVSLKIDGELRGCIGTIEPTQSSLFDEILMNAVSAASRDPRFPPVTPDELSVLLYSVDVLTAPESITNSDELDVKRYGVIVTSGPKRGVLLPDLDGVDTVERQLMYVSQKAGILPGEPVEMQRFEVNRFK